MTIFTFTSHLSSETTNIPIINISSNNEQRKNNIRVIQIKDETQFIDIKEAAIEICQNSKCVINTKYITKRILCKLLLKLSKICFQFTKYKTINKNVKSITVYDKKSRESYINYIFNLIHVGDLVRSLASEPSNVMYPDAFCNTVKNLFGPYSFIKIKILNDDEIRKQNLNLVYAVGQGSIKPPRFLVIEMNKSNNPLCLIGKGVCYDSGGINLKQNPYGMNTDKTGGAFVVGIIYYFCQKHQSKSVVGIIPLVENMIGQNSIKSGDIITSYSGQTVEIIDTDAEGRLIIADSISYAIKNYKPSYILDFATLTGAAEIRHNDHSYMYYSTNSNLINLVKNKGENIVGERGIQIFKWPEYSRYTKSTVADFKNMNIERAGEFTATMFLSNFIPNSYMKKWIHFDICNSHTGNVSNGNGFYTSIQIANVLSKSSK